MIKNISKIRFWNCNHNSWWLWYQCHRLFLKYLVNDINSVKLLPLGPAYVIILARVDIETNKRTRIKKGIEVHMQRKSIIGPTMHFDSAARLGRVWLLISPGNSSPRRNNQPISAENLNPSRVSLECTLRITRSICPANEIFSRSKF